MEETKIDEMTMKLLHYFIVERDYTPVAVHGIKDEIWLENMKEDYKIVRIVARYIHNDTQLETDNYRTERIAKAIKKQSFSLNVKVLNIYTDLGENAHLNDSKNMTSVLCSEDNLKMFTDKLKEYYPDINRKLIYKEDGFQLFQKLSEDISNKSVMENKRLSKVFNKKIPYITYSLIIINVLIYFFGILTGTYDSILDKYCLFAPYVVNGDYYRLFTSMFLHGDLLHLAFNMYALYIIGSQVESYIGKPKYLLVYILSGIFGSFLSIILNNNPSIGASGAIFGLMGSILYFGYHYRVTLGTAVRSQIVPLIIANLLFGFAVSGIDNFAHIGGLIGGVLTTSAVGIDNKETKTEQINGIIMTILMLVFLIYMALLKKV